MKPASVMRVTLQLEDYALLLGSIGLFVILAFVMYLTRGIDWFDIGAATNGQEARFFKKETDSAGPEI